MHRIFDSNQIDKWIIAVFTFIDSSNESHFSVRKKLLCIEEKNVSNELNLNFLKIIRRKKEKEVWNVQRLEDPWKWTVGVRVMENGVKGKLCFPFVHWYAVFIPALLISVDAKSERNAQPCSFWRKMEDRGDNGDE